MNPSAAIWQQFFVHLAVTVTVAVAATALLSRWLTRPAWRRPLWQACTLTLVGIFFFELVGINHELTAPFQRLIASRDNLDLASPLANQCGQTPTLPGCYDSNPDPAHESAHRAWPTRGYTLNIEPRTTNSRTEMENPTPQVVLTDLASNDLQPTETKPEFAWLTVWWPGLLWLLGAGLVAGRAAGARLLLTFLRFRHPPLQNAEFSIRFQPLANRLGIRGSTRVIELSGLVSPFTFGIFRPIIVLPATFVNSLDRAKQEVMLAHELAHVAGRDPAWLLVADLMTALLWWHPLAWWCRHQLHTACEAAADEASLLVADGPVVLAACLVELGGRLVNNPQVGGASVAGNGFRSSLGRRVDRLLQMNDQTWTRPPRRRLLVVLITTVPILLMLITLSAACLPWSGDPGTTGSLSKGDDPMTSWRHSIAGMALCAFLAPAAENVGAQDSPNPAPSGSTIQRKTTESPRPPADPIPEPTRLGVTQPKNQQEAPADGGTESVPLRTGDESGSAVVGSEPGQPQQAAPAPQRIKIFRITHRQPGEILEILRGLTPVFEGGAQGVPVSYAAFLSEGLNARPGMNPGGPGSGPGANMASMMAKMGRRTGSGGMAAKMGGPGVSSATEAPPSPCYFAVDGRTRSLIVRGTEKDLQAVADFVAILDLPDDKAIPKLKNVHAFKLRFAKPSVVIEVLKTLNIDVLVAQIPKSTILLLNGPDSAIKDATEIIEALDAEVKEGATKGPQGEPAPSETRLVH